MIKNNNYQVGVQDKNRAFFDKNDKICYYIPQVVTCDGGCKLNNYFYNLIVFAMGFFWGLKWKE